MTGALSRSIQELRKNERQWDAFSAEGNCVVVAPPGSGKTKLLTTRMAADLERHVPLPQGTACVTFTVAAASELRERLQRLGSETRATSFIGTVHGFALNCIVLPFAHVAGRPELATMQLATPRQEDAAYRLSVKANFPAFADTTNLKSTIGRMRSLFASEEEWRRLGEGVYETALGYRTELRSQGLIDFQGIVEEAVDIVQKFPTLQKVLRARYPRIYVDEYQDLPPGLDKLVRLLCFGGKTPSLLFAVGDPDQAIFSFLGTRPELLHQLAELDTVQLVTLDRNYRCGEAIVHKAALVKQSNQPTTGVRAGGSVSLKYCSGGYEEQLEEVARSIALLGQGGSPLEEISVICPTNADCLEVSNVLTRHGIASFFRATEYRLTVATSLIEDSAAWCFLGRELSGVRLASLLSARRRLTRRERDMESDAKFVGALRSIDPRANLAATDFIRSLLEAGLADAIGTAGADEEQQQVDRMLAAYEAGMGGNDAKQLASRGTKTGRVEVATMNSSKGREFTHVLIPGMDQNHIPSYHVDRDPSQLPEERRKFYVSLTRAKESVTFFYSGYVLTPWGDAQRKGPSVFLRELGLIEG